MSYDDLFDLLSKKQLFSSETKKNAVINQINNLSIEEIRLLFENATIQFSWEEQKYIIRQLHNSKKKEFIQVLLDMNLFDEDVKKKLFYKSIVNDNYPSKISRFLFDNRDKYNLDVLYVPKNEKQFRIKNEYVVKNNAFFQYIDDICYYPLSIDISLLIDLIPLQKEEDIVTALCAFAQFGNLNIMEHFIKNIDKKLLHWKDSYGKLPISYAKNEGKRRLLISNGSPYTEDDDSFSFVESKKDDGIINVDIFGNDVKTICLSMNGKILATLNN